MKNMEKYALRGVTWETLKKAPSLIPLYIALGTGITIAILYPLRCAIKSPDVTWNITKNPEPWNEYAKKPYWLFMSQEAKEYFKKLQEEE